MKKILCLLFFLLTTISSIVAQKEGIVAVHFEKSKFDAAIFPENYSYLIPEPRFTPTKDDVIKAENALTAQLRELNKRQINQLHTPIIHKKLKHYKRQYFGYINKNEDHILLINCFWHRKDLMDDWLKEIVVVYDGGSYYWSIKYNIEKNILFDLQINGGA